MNLHSHLLATALAGASLASCAQTSVESDSQRLSRELRTLIGPATCSADTQCRTVAVGAKACGGPSGYLAWSTAGTDAKRVAELAARQSEAQKRELQAGGMSSNCAVVVDPGAACMAAHCQLATPASAAR